jgi:hypothetical protein
VVQRSKFASVFLEHGKSSIEENQSETGTSLYSLGVTTHGTGATRVGRPTGEGGAISA